MSVSPVGMAWWWFLKEHDCPRCYANLKADNFKPIKGGWRRLPSYTWHYWWHYRCETHHYGVVWLGWPK